MAMRHARVILLVLPALAAGCAMLPPEEDPTNIKVSEIDSRVSRVERVIDNEGLMNLLKQLEQLQKENQALRNDVETLQHEVEQAGTRQKDQYVDVDQRLQALEKSLSGRAAAPAPMDGGAVVDGAALKPGALPVPGGSDRANYQAAFELLKQGRYQEANAALKQFMVTFPNSPLSDNAQYWFAETYYVGQTYDKALPAFQTVLDRFPQSRKIPDALVKIGYCNYELKRFDAARKALQAVVSSYPETTAARLARQRLERMSSEGV